MSSHTSRRYFFLSAIASAYLMVPLEAVAQLVERVTALAVDKGGIQSSLAVFKDAVYFTSHDGPNSIALWKYDGEQIEVVHAGFHDSWESTAMERLRLPALYISVRRRLCATNDKLYFTADDGAHGQELWEFDGQRAKLVADVYNGSNHSNPYQLTPCNGDLYFVATVPRDGHLTATVCKFDGHRVTRFPPDSSFKWNLDVRDMTAFEGSVYFYAYHDTFGIELWRCDGQQIRMVENYCPDDRLNLPRILTVFDHSLILSTSGPNHCSDLCKYQDGRISSMSDVSKDLLSCPHPKLLGIFDKNLFVLMDVTHRKTNRLTSPRLFDTTEIWNFNGDSFQKVTVVEKNPVAPNGRYCIPGEGLGGHLYFGFGDAEHGGELWRTDGRTAVLYEDIWKGGKGSEPNEFVSLKGMLYFLASDDSFGRQLWRLVPD